ncbi:MAG: molybdopterin-binding protein [Lachnospiraceae bacterium]|nr:molybdopterin-binding protein [Lachnospiraceae bacterium]
MKLVKTENAVGHILCHDITRIIPGVEKGPVFKKGHIVAQEDIAVLLSVGKENLYVWEDQPGMLHEDEAADILREICIGDREEMYASEPAEGKITISAATAGLLKVDSDRLKTVNSLGEMMIATVHGNFPVKEGDRIAATRIIPLVIEEEKMRKAKMAAGETPLLSIRPFRKPKTAMIITGSEVASGRIKDAFGPVLREKLAEYGIEPSEEIIIHDDQDMIREKILSVADNGAEMILVSGGMSVDPDDRTPGAVKGTGAKIVSYGAPVLPGAMFLLAYLKHRERTIPIMGLPGCVMYAKRTVFDLILPRILAGERLEAPDLTAYGEGGMCLGCTPCRFPNCGFGKA